LDPEKVTAHTSVVLFVDRARATKIGFEVTAENADAIGAICRRLDGLPLAIELAAARVGFLSPQTLLQRLDHALDVLATGGRDRPDRQLTLRAAIDWSHALLTESEQRLFRRLAVFQTAASLESIEAVCGQDDGDVFGDLGSLVDKSLVRAIGDGDRFGMLQTVREFALERLSAAGEGERLRLRHARQLARIVAQISVGIEGGNQAGSIELGVTEDSDIRAALDLLLERAKSGDVEAAELGMKMCGDLWMFWHIRARHLSARSYAAGFLDAAGEGRCLPSASPCGRLGVSRRRTKQPSSLTESPMSATTLE
jgi:predicted ATPase